MGWWEHKYGVQFNTMLWNFSLLILFKSMATVKYFLFLPEFSTSTVNWWECKRSSFCKSLTVSPTSVIEVSWLIYCRHCTEVSVINDRWNKIQHHLLLFYSQIVRLPWCSNNAYNLLYKLMLHHCDCGIANFTHFPNGKLTKEVPTSISVPFILYRWVVKTW